MPPRERKRRQKGSGTVYQRADGLWLGQVDIGYTPGGSRRKKTVTGRSETEVTKKLGRLLRQIDTGDAIATGNPTVKTYLERWSAGLTGKPKTLTSYRSNVRLYLIPHLGRHRLATLRPPQVRKMLVDMEDDGKSLSVRASAFRTLRAALGQAVVDGELTRHPLTGMRIPSPQASKAVLTADEAKTLMRSLDPADPLTVRWLVALLLGLRQGEALGLEWNRIYSTDAGVLVDVSWQLQRIIYRHGCFRPLTCGRKRAGSCPRRQLDIGEQYECRPVHGALCLIRPKSKVRVLPVPQVLHAALLAHRERHGVAPSGLVFTRPDGRPYEATDDNQAWHAALERAGVPSVKLHAARRTTATLLLEMGVPEHVSVEILGHADAATTRLYQVVSSQMSRTALSDLADLLSDNGSEPVL